jgi:thiol-disulfide isomerase/thioredoxin
MNKLYCLFFLITFISATRLYSQRNFIVLGKTNLLKNGKIVLLGNTSNPLYTLKLNSDTVQISNYVFKFEGTLNYPEQHRILILNTNYITEPFFVDSGFQEIKIDSLIQPHDILDVGGGIVMKGSKTNDEYFNKYLFLFKEVYANLKNYFSEINRCDTMTNLREKKLCIVNSDSVRSKLKVKRDSILLAYSYLNPKSKIIPWLINDALSYYKFHNLYKETFDQSKRFMPDKIIQYLDSFLLKEKLTSVGNLFPLIDFVNGCLSENYIQRNKFTLIDFWFVKCRPCIGQFNLLKDVYKANNNKGFEIVAISIDKQGAIQEYEKSIKQNGYVWKQILDTGGVNANRINISKYPTNFLLDNSGKIIAIDIKPFVLENFLSKNL